PYIRGLLAFPTRRSSDLDDIRRASVLCLEILVAEVLKLLKERDIPAELSLVFHRLFFRFGISDQPDLICTVLNPIKHVADLRRIRDKISLLQDDFGRRRLILLQIDVCKPHIPVFLLRHFFYSILVRYYRLLKVSFLHILFRRFDRLAVGLAAHHMAHCQDSRRCGNHKEQCPDADNDPHFSLRLFLSHSFSSSNRRSSRSHLLSPASSDSTCGIPRPIRLLPAGSA